MPETLRIRAIAAQLLKELCIKCDTLFYIKQFDVLEFAKNLNVDINEVSKASKYLIGKGYVNSQEVAYDKWNCVVTANGVDWVEDYLNAPKTL